MVQVKRGIHRARAVGEKGNRRTPPPQEKKKKGSAPEKKKKKVKTMYACSFAFISPVLCVWEGGEGRRSQQVRLSKSCMRTLTRLEGEVGGSMHVRDKWDECTSVLMSVEHSVTHKSRAFLPRSSY